MFHCLPNSDRADGNLTEAARQIGKMVEHPNQIQPNPGPREDGDTLWIGSEAFLTFYFARPQTKGHKIVQRRGWLDV